MSSLPDRVIVSLTLINRHTNPVAVFWLGKQDQEEQQYILGPGESSTQQSYQGDGWVFRDAVSQNEIWRTVAREDATVKLRFEQAKRKARNNGLPGIDVAHRPESDDTQFALAFDGDNDIIIVPERVTGADLGAAWTLEAWVNRRRTGELHPIVDKTDGHHGGYLMRIGANDRLQGGIQQNGQLILGESAATIPAGLWTHVAVVFDARRYLVQCYVNGRPETTALTREAPHTHESLVARFDGQQYFWHDNASVGRSDALTVEAWVQPRPAPTHVAPTEVFDDVSLAFNGSTSVALGIPKTYDQLQDALTVEFWYKGDYQGEPFHFFSYTDDQHYLEIKTGGGEHSVRYNAVIDKIPAGTQAADGRWHHVAFTWQKGAAGGFISYLDGEEQSRKEASNQSWHIDVAQLRLRDPWTITNRLGSTSLRGDSIALHGQMAEFRLWSVVRTREELNTAMHARLTGKEPGLVAYVPLSEGKGTAALELVNGALCPIDTGSWAMGTRPAFQRQSVLLRGRETVRIPAGVFQGIDREVTIECWFRGTAFQSAVALKSQRTDIRGLISLGKQVVLDAGAEQYGMELPDHVNDGQWHHIALEVQIYQRSDRYGHKGRVYLYFDGLPLASVEVRSVEHTLKAIYDQSELFLGSDRGESQFLRGELAEVRIWNVARSAQQISAYHRRSLAGNEEGLVGYWRLDQNGELFKDSTANAHHGRFQGLQPGVNYGVLPTDGVGVWRNADQQHDHGLLLRRERDTTLAVFRVAGQEVIAADHAIPAGQWTHLAGVWQAGRQFRLYVNGLLSGEADARAAAGGIDIAGGLYLGYNPSTNKGFDGDLAHVRLWRRAWAADDLARNRWRAWPEHTPSLAANWRLTDGPASASMPVYHTAHDSSGNGHHLHVPRHAVATLNVGGAGALYVPHHEGLAWSGSFSLEMWLALDTLDRKNLNLFSKGSSCQLHLIKASDAPGAPTLLAFELEVVNGKQKQRVTVQTDAAYSLIGQGWLHVAVVYDETNRQLRLTICHTGAAHEQVFSQIVPEESQFASGQDAIWLGESGARDMAQIAEVRLWRGARSHAQLEADRYRLSTMLRGAPNLAAAWLSGDQWWQDHGMKGVAALPMAYSSAIPAQTSFAPPREFTIAFWCRVVDRDFASMRYILYEGGNYADNNLLSFSGTREGSNRNKAVVSHYVWSSLTFSIDWPLNSWHHIVLAFNLNTEVVIYVDGHEVGRHSAIDPAYPLASIFFKPEWWAPDKIHLDDLHFLRGVLTPAEVAPRLALGLPGQSDPTALFSLRSPATVAYWNTVTQQDFDLRLLTPDMPGAADTSLALLPEMLEPSDSAQPLRIGTSASSTPAFFRGMLDSLRLWDIARMPSQVADAWDRQIMAQNRGLRAYYRFDEGKDDLVQDSTAARNHGRFQGTPAWEIIDGTNLPGGEDNQFVLKFDGEDDAIIVANPVDTGLSLHGAWTVEAWVFRQSRGKVHPIVDKTDGERGGYFLRIGANDRLQGGIRKGQTLVYVESDATIEPMRWVHVAVSFDPDRYSGSCYLNGNPTPSQLRQALDASYFSTVADLSGQRSFSYGKLLVSGAKALTAELWLKPHSFSTAAPFTEARSGLAFNGQTDSIEVPFSGIDELLEGFTVECWYRGTQLQSLLRTGIGTPIGSIQIGANGTFQLRIFDTLGRTHQVEATIPAQAADGQWHHLAFVSEIYIFNPKYSDRTFTITIYLDGQQVDKDQIHIESRWQFSVELNHVTTAYIGAFQGASDFLQGQLSEFRIWNQGRSAAQIKALMNSTLRGDEAGLFAYWPLNEGSGDTAHDLTASKRHGQLRGYPQWFDNKIRGGAGAALLAEVDKQRDFGLLLRGEAEQGTVAFRVHGREIAAPARSIALEEWQHVAAVWQAGARFRLYLNGALVAQQDEQAPTEALAFGEGLLVGFNPATQIGLHGEMSSVRLWDNACDEASLNEYCGRVLPEGTPGLLASWRLNDPWLNNDFLPDQRINDSSGNERHLNASLIHARSMDAGGRFGFLTARLNQPVGETFTVETWLKVDGDIAVGQTLIGSAAWQLAILKDPVHIANRSMLAFTLAPANIPMQFDGVADYVTVPNTTGWRLKQWTVEAWIYVARFKDELHQGPVVSQCGENKGWELHAGAGKIAFVAFLNRDGYQLSVEANLAAGAWHHIAGVWQDLTGISLYVDGKLAAQELRRSYYETELLELTFGRNPQWQDRAFAGSIREVRLWDVALNEQQVAQNMKRMIVGREGNLLGCWLLRGNAVQDVTGQLPARSSRSVAPAASQPRTVYAESVALTGQGWIHVAAVHGRLPDDAYTDELKSTAQGAHSVELAFKNDYSKPVTVLWVDQLGIEKQYTLLEPNKVYTVGSFAGHAWRFRDDTGRTIAEYVAPVSKATFSVRERRHSKVWIYVTPQGASTTQVFTGEFPAEAGLEVAGDVLLGDLYGAAGDVRLSEVRVWREARDPSLLDRFRYHQYSAVNRGYPQLAGLWLGGAPGGNDASSAGNHAIGSAELLAKGFFDEPALLLYGERTPWRNSRSDFALLPATLNTPTTHVPLKIGAGLPDNSKRYLGNDENTSFHGLLDAIRIWDTARTPQEINRYWNQALSGREDGLRAYYRFDEGKGEIVHDNGQFGNHGQFGGANDVADVRVWNVARTAAQLHDTHDQTLVAQDGLLVNWPLPEINQAPSSQEVAQTGAIRLDGDFTLELRVNVRTLNLVGRYHAVLYRGDDWALNVVSDQTELYAGFYFNYAGRELEQPWQSLIATDSPITRSEWVHLAVVGDRKQGKLSLYVDGVEQAMPFTDLSGAVYAFPADESVAILVGGEGKPAWWKSNLLIIDGLEFDGRNDFIRVPPIEEEWQNGLTIEAWVFYTSFKNWSRVADFGDGTGQHALILANEAETNTLVFEVWRDGVVKRLQVAGALELQRWQHLAAVIGIVKDAHDQAIGVRTTLYKNGEVIAESDDLHLPAANAFQNNYLGRSNRDGDGFFQGRIDEVRLWRSARSSADIQAFLRREVARSHRDLAALWSFDEGSGNAAYDGSSNGYHALLGDGKPSASPRWLNLTERRNAGLAFDGIDDLVLFPHEAEFDFPGHFTVECWVNIAAWSRPWQTIISKGDSWQLRRYGETGKLAFTTSGLSNTDLVSNAEIADGLWHHVAVVYNRRYKYLYIDGRRDTLETASGALILNDRPLVLGDYPDLSGRQYKGQIDELRIWQVARKDAEIAANMHARVDENAEGLVGYWPMNENFGDTIYDKSGHGLDGTLGGGQEERMPSWTESSPLQFNGFHFNGCGDYLEVETSDSLDLTTDFTLSAWVRPALFGGLQTILSKADTMFDVQYALSLEGVQLRFDYARDGNNFTLVGGELKDGWNHVAAVVRTSETQAEQLELRTTNPADLANAQVVAYAGPQFTGRSLALTVGDYTAEQLGFGDGGIQSLRVPPGLNALVFEHNRQDPEGHWLRVTADEAELIHPLAGTTANAVRRYLSLRVTAEQLVHEQWINQPKIMLYVNGLLVHSAQAPIATRPSQASVWIGGWGGDADGQAQTHHFFHGRLDVVCIWNRSLTQEEIQETMHTELDPVPASISALWYLDEEQHSSATGLVDRSRNDNHGVYHYFKPVGDDPTHLQRPALLLDGTSTYIDMTSASLPADNEPYTIELWCKPAAAHEMSLLSWGDATPNSRTELRLLDGRRLCQSWGGPDLTAQLTIDLTEGWHHIAAVWDGRQRLLYLDGSIVATDTPGEHKASIGNGRIGAAVEGRFFEGMLADVRVWRRARDRFEIKTDMNRLLFGSEPGLVGYWRLNEGRGTTATNLAMAHMPRAQPNPIHGESAWSIESGLPSYSVLEDDRQMDALALNIDASVLIPYHADFDPGAAFTVECWFSIERGRRDWLALVANGEYSWSLRNYNRSGRLSFAVPGLTELDLVSRNPVNDGRWHHVVAVYEEILATAEDGTQALFQEKRLYIDGMLESMSRILQDGFTPNTGAGSLVLGRRLTGMLGEVRLWNQSLTPSQIRYNLRHTLLGGEPGLVGYWNFAEQGGREVLDSSGRDHHGVFDGTATWMENSGVPLDSPTTCLFFDGKADQLVADDPLVSPAINFTLEGWVCPATLRGQLIAVFNCVDGRKITAGFADERTVEFSFGDEQPLTATVSTDPGEWLHLAFVYNLAEQRRSIHISTRNAQGAIETRTALDLATLMMPAISGQLTIGGAAGAAPGFHGYLSDLRLWHVARNREEIRTNLARRLRGTEEGLMAYWPLSETRLPYVRDYGFDGYHAMRQGARMLLMEGLVLKSGGTLKLPPNMRQMADSYQRALKHSLGILPDRAAFSASEFAELPAIEFAQVEIDGVAAAEELDAVDAYERLELIARADVLIRDQTIVRDVALNRTLVVARPATRRVQSPKIALGSDFFEKLPRPKEPYRTVIGSILQALAAQIDDQPRKQALLACRQSVLVDGAPPPESVRQSAAEAVRDATLTLNSALLGELNIFADQLLMHIPEISIRQPQLIALDFDGSFAVLGGATIDGLTVEVEVHLLAQGESLVILRFKEQLPLSRVVSTVTFGGLDLPKIILDDPEIHVTRGAAAGDGSLGIRSKAIIRHDVKAQMEALVEKAGQELHYLLHFELPEGRLADIFDDLPDVGDLDLANGVIQPASFHASYGPLNRRMGGKAAQPDEPAATADNYHQLSLGGTLVLGQRQVTLDSHLVRLPGAQQSDPAAMDYTISLRLESEAPQTGFALNQFFDDLPTFGQLDLNTAIVDNAHLDIAKESLNPEVPGSTFSFSLDGDVSNVFSGKTISLDSDFIRHSEPGAAPARRWRSAGESEYRIRLTAKETEAEAEESLAFSDVFDDFPAIGEIDMRTVFVEEFDITISKKAVVAEGGRRAPTTSDIRCSFDGKVLFGGQYRLTLDSDFIRYHDLAGASAGINELDYSVVLRLDERGGGPRSVPFNNVVADMPAVGNFDLASANQGQSVSVSDFEIAIKKTSIGQQRKAGTTAGPSQNYLALSFDGKIEDLFKGHSFSLNADFMKYTETMGAGKTAAKGNGVQELDFTLRLALQRPEDDAMQESDDAKASNDEPIAADDPADQGAEPDSAGKSDDPGRAGLSLAALFDDFPQFGDLSIGDLALDEVEFVLKRTTRTQAAKAGAKVLPNDTEVQLSIDGKASLTVGENTFQVALDTDFSKHSYAGAKSRSLQDLDMKVQIQLSEGSFAFANIFPDFPAIENVDLAATTISRPTFLIHTNSSKQIGAAKDKTGTAAPSPTAKTVTPVATYNCFSLAADVTLFGLDLHMEGDFINNHQTKGKKAATELDYTVTITPRGLDLPSSRRGPADFAAPAADQGPPVPFGEVVGDFPAMGGLDLGVAAITGFYLRINKNSLTKLKPTAKTAVASDPAAVTTAAADEPSLAPPTLADAKSTGGKPSDPSAAPPLSPTPKAAPVTPSATAVQLAFGGQIEIAGKTFRLDALFEKESTQKSGVVKGAATAYMVKLMLDDEIGFNALVDDVDSYANFDLMAFGVTRPTILISKSSTQAKSSVADQVVCSITSEAVTMAGVVASLEAHYTKDSLSRIDKSGATGATGATGTAKAPAATKGSSSQASYQITLVLKEDVSFSQLIEALPAVENLEFETVTLKPSTQLVLTRTLQTAGATVRRSGGTTMTISGPVGTTIGDMTIQATYTKLMASTGKPATTEYVIEVRADYDMRLDAMFSELGLEDNPFGASIAALPAAQPYFRITNQPGSLEAAIRQPK